MGVEDVGVVCAVHHLTAGFVVFVAAAVRAVGLGPVAVACHPVTGVAHCASTPCYTTGKKCQQSEGMEGKRQKERRITHTQN